MNSVFAKSPCRGFYKIPQFFRSLKWAYQRATRGYADCDVWDIDMWFLSVMPDMLKQLADTTISHPFDTTSEEWKTTLYAMIQCFNKAGDDPLDSGTLPENWAELEKERDEKLHEGLEIFNKHFWDLWD